MANITLYTGSKGNEGNPPTELSAFEDFLCEAIVAHAKAKGIRGVAVRRYDQGAFGMVVVVGSKGIEVNLEPGFDLSSLFE